MKISDEIIQVLEYLCEKFGLTIDWTSDNIFPYIEQLCGKFIKWEISTSIAWIIIAVVCCIITLIFSINISDSGPFWCILCVAVIVIGFQTFDIIECNVFPEKVLYDYITTELGISIGR
jgi:hypothetical protein